MSGADGAYVRFPTDDLLGILALEAERHRALVVGEDLGTVPPEVPPTLKRWGVLGTRVFFFEREGEAFRPAAAYEPKSFTTATTHDMAPLAGFWAGRDIELRRATGMIENDEALEHERQRRARAKQAMLTRLAEDGALPEAREPASSAALRGAVHRFLLYTPAVMVGLNLDDLVGESEPVNIPGVTPDRYASWTRKLALPVERLGDDAGVRTALTGVTDGPGVRTRR
jgi:4-alpha-glucanotransferase